MIPEDYPELVERTAFALGELPDNWSISFATSGLATTDPGAYEFRLTCDHWGIERTVERSDLIPAEEAARWLCDQRRAIEDTMAYVP